MSTSIKLWLQLLTGGSFHEHTVSLFQASIYNTCSLYLTQLRQRTDWGSPAGHFLMSMTKIYLNNFPLKKLEWVSQNLKMQKKRMIVMKSATLIRWWCNLHNILLKMLFMFFFFLIQAQLQVQKNVTLIPAFSLWKRLSTYMVCSQTFEEPVLVLAELIFPSASWYRFSK